MSSGLLIALSVLLPVAGAFVVLALGKWPNAREAVTLITGGGTLWLVSGLLPYLREGARPRLDILEGMPGVQLAFEVEPLGLLFTRSAT